ELFDNRKKEEQNIIYILYLVAFHSFKNAWFIKAFFRSNGHTDIFFLERNVKRIMSLLRKFYQFFHEVRRQDVSSFKLIRCSCFKVIVKLCVFQSNSVHLFFRKQTI